MSDPLRLLPLGDALVLGAASAAGAGARMGGWRTVVQRLAREAGWSVECAGHERNGPADTDPRHQGMAGWRLAQVAQELPRWLPVLRPQMILVQAGLDELLQGGGEIGVGKGFAALLDQLDRLASEVVVLVAPIPLPRADNAAGLDPELVARANWSIAAAVDAVAQRGRKLRMVDPALSAGDLADDGVHLGISGHQKLGEAFARAMAPFVDQTPSGVQGASSAVAQAVAAAKPAKPSRRDRWRRCLRWAGWALVGLMLLWCVALVGGLVARSRARSAVGDQPDLAALATAMTTADPAATDATGALTRAFAAMSDPARPFDPATGGARRRAILLLQRGWMKPPGGTSGWDDQDWAIAGQALTALAPAIEDLEAAATGTRYRIPTLPGMNPFWLPEDGEFFHAAVWILVAQAHHDRHQGRWADAARRLDAAAAVAQLSADHGMPTRIGFSIDLWQVVAEQWRQHLRALPATEPVQLPPHLAWRFASAALERSHQLERLLSLDLYRAVDNGDASGLGISRRFPSPSVGRGSWLDDLALDGWSWFAGSWIGKPVRCWDEAWYLRRWLAERANLGNGTRPTPPTEWQAIQAPIGHRLPLNARNQDPALRRASRLSQLMRVATALVDQRARTGAYPAELGTLRVPGLERLPEGLSWDPTAPRPRLGLPEDRAGGDGRNDLLWQLPAIGGEAEAEPASGMPMLPDGDLVP